MTLSSSQFQEACSQLFTGSLDASRCLRISRSSMSRYNLGYNAVPPGVEAFLYTLSVMPDDLRATTLDRLRQPATLYKASPTTFGTVPTVDPWADALADEETEK